VYEVVKEPKVDPTLTYYYHKPQVKKLMYESDIKRAKQISRMVRAGHGNVNFDDIIKEIDNEIKEEAQDQPVRFSREMNEDIREQHKRFDNDESLIGVEINSRGNAFVKTAPTKFNVFTDDIVPYKRIDEAVQTESIDKRSVNESNKNQRVEFEDLVKRQIENNESLRESRRTNIEDYTTDKFGSKASYETADLHKILRETLKHHIKQYINDFCTEYDIKSDEAEILKQTCYEMFYTKALKILTMIFSNNKDKFFELLNPAYEERNRLSAIIPI